MAYTTFPAYAQFLLDGFEVAMSGGVQRDEMSDGYVQQVPLQSRGRAVVPLTYRLASLGDKAAFELWRSVDLVHGALWFAWVDPRDRAGATVRRARIVGGEVTYRPKDRRMENWLVSFTLEYWSAGI